MGGLIAVDEAIGGATHGSSSQQQIEQSLVGLDGLAWNLWVLPIRITGMSVWILEGGQKSSDGKAKQPSMDKNALERIRRSFVENLFVASKFRNNWIVCGGRSPGGNGNVIVLGGAYCFHFPTGEWARLDPIADTDRDLDTAARYWRCFSHVFRHELFDRVRTKTWACTWIDLKQCYRFLSGKEEEQFLVDREAGNWTLEFRRRELAKSSSAEIFS